MRWYEALFLFGSLEKVVNPVSHSLRPAGKHLREEFRPIALYGAPHMCQQSVLWCWSGSQPPVFRFLSTWRHLTACFKHPLFPPWRYFKTPRPEQNMSSGSHQYLLVYAALLALQLLLPLASGSALGISISLCDPGPCASTAICQVSGKSTTCTSQLLSKGDGQWGRMLLRSRQQRQSFCWLHGGGSFN